MAQVVECLLGNLKALSSNPITANMHTLTHTNNMVIFFKQCFKIW
jgi:hypothetical protein